MSLDFSAMTLAWFDEVTPLSRFNVPGTFYGAAPAAFSPPQTGFWYDPTCPGSGYFLETQDSALWIAAFTYGTNNRPTWVTTAGSLIH